MTPANLKHFILTRFNVRVKEWHTTKKGELVLSDEWLEHRFKLFETYCFPSVKNQTNQDFTWFVFFDAQTPTVYKNRIDQLHRQYINFLPLFINDFSELLPVVKNEIKARIHPGVSYIITSRMDNDDSLHKEYIREVQREFKQQSLALVDIVDGYNLSIEPTVKLGKIRSHLNPFSSLIEEALNPQTVLSRSHTDWGKSNIITVKHKRLWLQIIHEKNKVNTYRGIRVASLNKLHSDFGISLSLVSTFPPTSLPNVLIENMTMLLHLIIKKSKKLGYKLLGK